MAAKALLPTKCEAFCEGIGGNADVRVGRPKNGKHWFAVFSFLPFSPFTIEN